MTTEELIKEALQKLTIAVEALKKIRDEPSSYESWITANRALHEIGK